MSGVWCALLVLLQGQALDVTAAVDRARVPVGEEVTLTIQVRAQGVDAPRFDLPPLSGFSVVGTRDAAEVALEGAAGATRTAMRALTLRAERPGRLTIGSVRVHVGDAVATTAPFTIEVDSAASFPASALSALARALLAAAPSPNRGDRVALSIVAPTAPAIVGHQFDVVLAAWFPRSLRERLRRPPLLTLLTPENVWSYPPAAPSGVVLSRQVHGQPMDLYAVHQILFPLSAGMITIPPGSVRSAWPSSRSPMTAVLPAIKGSSPKACSSRFPWIHPKGAWVSRSKSRRRCQAGATWRCGRPRSCIGRRDFARIRKRPPCDSSLLEDSSPE